MKDVNKHIHEDAKLITSLIATEDSYIDDEQFTAVFDQYRQQAINNLQLRIEGVSTLTLDDHLAFFGMSSVSQAEISQAHQNDYALVNNMIGTGKSTLYRPGNMTDAQFALAYNEGRDKAVAHLHAISDRLQALELNDYKWSQGLIDQERRFGPA